MDFWLLYAGPLRATQGDPKPGSGAKSRHWLLKHEMRKVFHRQLQAVWGSHSLLVSKQGEAGSMLNTSQLADAHRVPPWSFVPLVTHELDVVCEIEVTLLRRDHPGDSVWSGDIDNRLKTLIDALRTPTRNDGYADSLEPEASYDPMYCLMSDDKLLTRATLETGRLLDAPDNADQTYAHVTTRVRVRADSVTMLNIGL